MPQLAKTDEEIESCFDVMSELRPHLKKDEFLSIIRQMETDGYRMAYIRENEEVVAVAGYRIYTNLALGKHLYLDDLVTSAQARSRGYGEVLIRWLREIAKSAGCQVFHLDSGTHRGRAHKFYFRHGFTIASYHFSEELD